MRDLVVRGEDPAGPALVNDGEGRAYGVQMLARQQLAKQLLWLGLVHVVAQPNERITPARPGTGTSSTRRTS